MENQSLRGCSLFFTGFHGDTHIKCVNFANKMMLYQSHLVTRCRFLVIMFLTSMLVGWFVNSRGMEKALNIRKGRPNRDARIFGSWRGLRMRLAESLNCRPCPAGKVDVSHGMEPRTMHQTYGYWNGFLNLTLTLYGVLTEIFFLHSAVLVFCLTFSLRSFSLLLLSFLVSLINHRFPLLLYPIILTYLITWIWFICIQFT